MNHLIFSNKFLRTGISIIFLLIMTPIPSIFASESGQMGKITVSDTAAYIPSNRQIGFNLLAPIGQPSIDIRKEVEGADTRIFPTGSDVTFEIVVTNTGNVDLSNVVVSDPLLPDCSRVIGSLAIGQVVTFTCTALNVTVGFTNVAQVSGTVQGITVTDSDPSRVKVSSIDIRKQLEGSDSREFPDGSDVPFEIVVTNTGEVALTNVEVSDPLVPDCSRVIGSLGVGETFTYTCTAPAVVVGFTNIATVTGQAGEHTVSDEDPSTVVIPPTATPGIDIRKEAEGPDSRDFPSGSDVSFNIVVTNIGDVDLTDVTVSDALVPGCDLVIGFLGIGQNHSYSCTALSVTESFTNTASVTGMGGETPVSDEDPSSVNIILYTLYFPFMSEPGVTKYDLSLGFEDLRLDQPNDFDYNDWVVSVNTDLHYDSIAGQTLNLTEIHFLFTPRARGAALNHEFHLHFPENTFGSDGDATLIIRNGQGDILSNTTVPFTATQLNHYVLFPSTFEALPPAGNLVNTTEGLGPNPPERTAELTITFDTGAPFTLTDFGPHGEGLFFEPHLYVASTVGGPYDIFVGDVRTIVFPILDWLWPEERIRIDNAYPNIIFLGPPTMFDFPDNWWVLYNECIYGDGVVCPIPNPTSWLEQYLH